MVNPSKKLIINTLVYSWRPQINAVTLKVSKGLGLLSKIKDTLFQEKRIARDTFLTLSLTLAKASTLFDF